MSRERLLQLLTSALFEDCPNDDITSLLIFPPEQSGKAKIIAKSYGVFYGTEIIDTFFRFMDPDSKIIFYKQNGEAVESEEKICDITSKTRVILEIERVLLNILQRLSGVATITNAFVKRLNNPKIKILDTRKTTPMMRFLERKAVKAGGGTNHRYSLSDMVLLKENHLIELRKTGRLTDFPMIIKDYKKENPLIKVEVEIENLRELEEIDLSEVDIIMFDDFPLEDIEKGIKICKDKKYKAGLEVSGSINLDNIQQYAKFDIQRISIGSLTHSVKVLDLSLLCYG